ncbi:hypothetical protein D5H75_22875 [Bailinhaonella thermotolerans]|uniref:Uncharacterized protein n=1 Tax=Bailinhaonella thermotolerans TaxID=1070861 RepID=A0A3A4B8G6_9ACTN|nr:hypothetical protein D5H75_22875 [Bailinhaonella thermotolerans]
MDHTETLVSPSSGGYPTVGFRPLTVGAGESREFALRLRIRRCPRPPELREIERRRGVVLTGLVGGFRVFGVPRTDEVPLVTGYVIRNLPTCDTPAPEPR